MLHGSDLHMEVGHEQGCTQGNSYLGTDGEKKDLQAVWVLHTGHTERMCVRGLKLVFGSHSSTGHVGPMISLPSVS